MQQFVFHVKGIFQCVLNHWSPRDFSEVVGLKFLWGLSATL